MNLKDYYYSLDKKGKSEYAGRLDTSTEYLRIHLIPRNGVPDRTPPLAKLEEMADASSGKVSFEEVAAHFSVKRKHAV